MRNSPNRINRFFFRNQDKGIPNLMLYITLGNAVVLIMSLFNGGALLYEALYFDKAKILQGEVWRLLTFVFTQSGMDPISLIFLYFFYLLGKNVENRMGTLKFNLYYLTGVVMMDVFAMIFSPMYPTSLYANMGYYLHLSLILTFATTHPDAQFLAFFFVPIKAWVLALIYLLIVLADVFNLSYPTMLFPHNLFPLVALGNYFLFMGSEVKNLLPPSWRSRRPKVKQARQAAPKAGPIPFRQAEQKKNYMHRCTVCGRTDVSNPDLEFRYCSRCKGYHCYCQDHISNHSHIEE